MKHYYRRFDVVLIHNFHSNVVFDEIADKVESDINIHVSKNELGAINNEYIKSRPALILSRLTNPLTKVSAFLIVPMTTKLTSPTISKYFRSNFDVLKRKSFLMWDQVKMISENQIVSLFSMNGETINLTSSTKKYVIREGNTKILNWINLSK